MEFESRAWLVWVLVIGAAAFSAAAHCEPAAAEEKAEAPATVCEEVPIHLSLTAETVPLVGQVGSVRATVTVDYDLPNVEVEIELPSGGQLIDPPQMKVEMVSSATPLVRSSRVVFSKPGNKFVRAVARVEESPGVVWSTVVIW